MSEEPRTSGCPRTSGNHNQLQVQSSCYNRTGSTPVLLFGKSHGQRSLAGYRPWGLRELDTTQSLNSNSINNYPNSQSQCICVKGSDYSKKKITSLTRKFLNGCQENEHQLGLLQIAWNNKKKMDWEIDLGTNFGTTSSSLYNFRLVAFLRYYFSLW